MTELTQSWNNFIKSLVATKNAWDTLAELMKARPKTESLPIDVQKVMSFATVKRGSKFNLAMPRLLDHFRRYGGFEDLEIPVLKPKEKEKGNARTKPKPRSRSKARARSGAGKKHSG